MVIPVVAITRWTLFLKATSKDLLMNEDFMYSLSLLSYGDEDEVIGAVGGVESKPRILLMGLRRYALVLCILHDVLCRSGKSSIQKVVFHKLSPNETLFLESTSKVVKDGMIDIFVN